MEGSHWAGGALLLWAPGEEAGKDKKRTPSGEPKLPGRGTGKTTRLAAGPGEVRAAGLVSERPALQQSGRLAHRGRASESRPAGGKMGVG